MNTPDFQMPPESAAASLLDNLSSLDSLRAEIASTVDKLDAAAVEILHGRVQKVAHALGELASSINTASPSTHRSPVSEKGAVAAEYGQRSEYPNSISPHEPFSALGLLGSSATYTIDVPYVYVEPPQPEPLHVVVDLLEQATRKIGTTKIPADNVQLKKKKRV